MSEAGSPSKSESRRCLVGAEAIAAALAQGAPLRLLLCAREGLSEPARAAVAHARREGVRVRAVSARELLRFTPGEIARAVPEALVPASTASGAAGDDRPEGLPELLALVGPPVEATLAGLMKRAGAVWLLARCAYPSNVGPILRSAEVSGAAGVVVDADWSAVERRRCLRASMRADRLLPVLFEPAPAVVEAAHSAGRRILVIEEGGERAPWQADLTGDALFVAGGEAGGVPADLLARADAVLHVPMDGFIPSYNVQAAVAIVMGERLRQASA